MFEILGCLEQMPTFAQQLLAGLGQDDARAMALEQGHAKVLLELGDRVGNGRRHAEQLARGGRERATAIDGIEDLQGIEAQAQHSKISMIDTEITRFPFDVGAADNARQPK